MEKYGTAARKRLNHLLGELEAVYHQISLRLGVSDSVSKILYTICNAGDRCLLREICKQTGLSKQTVHSAVQGLEREGLVSLTAMNGRSKIICLTESGKCFTKQTVRRIIEMEDAVFLSWKSEEVENCLALTERFLADLRERAEQI